MNSTVSLWCLEDYLFCAMNKRASTIAGIYQDDSLPN
jgi:hypothetical protein